MRKFCLLFIVFFTFISCSSNNKKFKLFALDRPYFLYSDIKYIEDAGDYLGTEILLTNGEKGYSGYIQICQGWSSDLLVIRDVRIDNDSGNISFAIGKEGKFTGTIMESYISGEIFLSKDFIMEIKKLKRVLLYKLE